MSSRPISRRSFLAALGTVAVARCVPTASTVSAEPRVPSEGRPGKVRFGITAQQAVYDDVLRLWQEAEALGFDTAFVYDHFMAPAPGPPEAERYLESWSLLSALAARTERLRIGVLVTAMSLRHAAILAKMAATVDHVSRGRLIIGLGAGWMEREHVAYGIPFLTKGKRAKRLVEAVEVMRRLFTQPRTTFEGRYFTLKDAPLEPKPVQGPQPPILIGGMGPKIVQPLAARYAQTWHIGLGPNDPASIRRTFDVFDALCRKANRDPREVERATFVDPRLVQSSGDDLRRQLEGLRDVGMGHFILLPPKGNDATVLRRFAKEIIPAFR